MDLMTELLQSNGCTMIVMFADKMANMIHFLSTWWVDDASRLFIHTIFELYGIIEVIIVNWGPIFPKKYCMSLFDLLVTDLLFSTASHPQIDGNSDRIIQILETFWCHTSKGTLQNGVDTYTWLNSQPVIRSMWQPDTILSISMLESTQLSCLHIWE